MISKKQKAVIDHIRKHGKITTKEAVDLIGRNIYHNAAHYVGQSLKQMVDRGLIKRESKGVYVEGGESAQAKPRWTPLRTWLLRIGGGFGTRRINYERRHRQTNRKDN